jgi:hypothetical protein
MPRVIAHMQQSLSQVTPCCIIQQNRGSIVLALSVSSLEHTSINLEVGDYSDTERIACNRCRTCRSIMKCRLKVNMESFLGANDTR